ncbi:MAG: DUF255 domain-containing protein [Bacteroidales bacterium]|nr:DUF255 domain-containing protein [Bacteroidales bacterium]
MKKLLLILAMACFIATGLKAQSVEWKTIEQASKIDTKSNAKLFFVDFYTSWCGWCKKMDKSTFTDPTVIKILNTYYVPVKFDAEGNSEFTWDGTKYTSNASKTNTHSFAKKSLGPRMGFPSFGIFKSNQQLITVVQGYQTAEDFAIILWYYASGDNARYPFEKYMQIFDKEIRPVMNKKLGIK